jgi:hypothetical protein
MAESAKKPLALPSRDNMEELWAAIHNMEIDGYDASFYGSGPSYGIRFEREDFAGDGGVSIYYAKVTGKTSTWIYTATIYTNLDDTGAPSGTGTTGQTLKVPTNYLASGETIPNGTILECRMVSWKASSTLATTASYYTVCQHVGLI